MNSKETDKRIQDIAKNQQVSNVTDGTKAIENDLVDFDYVTTVDEKSFKGRREEY